MKLRRRRLWKYRLQDARKFELEEGALVSIASRRGDIQARIKISRKAVAGTIFIPFHYAAAAANRLTNAALDPISGIPEYKVCAVKAVKSSLKSSGARCRGQMFFEYRISTAEECPTAEVSRN